MLTLKLSRKKAQFFFKRYHEFETKYGDEQSQASVLQRAQEFVATLKGAAAGSDAGAADVDEQDGDVDMAAD